MPRKHLLSLVFGVSFATLTACGGGAPPKAPPPPKAAAKEQSKEPEAAPVPAKEVVPKPSKPPSDVLISNDTMFSLNFSSSEPGKKAEERCDKQYAKNPKQRNACMRKARTGVKEDVLQFTKDDKGRLYWTISQQKGSKLKRIKKVQFKLGKETENSIEIKLLGGSGRTLVIQIPNDYTIAVPNQKYGKLVYDAKVDLPKE
jgi:hypothetical protein